MIKNENHAIGLIRFLSLTAWIYKISAEARVVDDSSSTFSGHPVVVANQQNVSRLLAADSTTVGSSTIISQLENDTSSSSSSSLHHSSNTVESYFSITCCRSGHPVPDTSIKNYVTSFESQFVGSIFADRQTNTMCDRYNGKYGVPVNVTNNSDRDFSSGVKCQCPEENLDRNCRQIVSECHNGGYRAFSINLRCVCPGLYFGDLCEKYCLNGRLERNEQQIVDKCVCQPNFYGEQCEKIVCFHGGTPVNGRGCSCPPYIFGQHCETRINSAAGGGQHLEMSLSEWGRPDNAFGSLDPTFTQSRRDMWDATGAGASTLLLILAIGILIYHYSGRRCRPTRRLTSDPVGGGPSSINTVTGELRTPNNYGTTENGVLEMLAPLPTYEEAIKTSYVVNNMPTSSTNRISQNNTTSDVIQAPNENDAQGSDAILPPGTEMNNYTSPLTEPANDSQGPINDSQNSRATVI